MTGKVRSRKAVQAGRKLLTEGKSLLAFTGASTHVRRLHPARRSRQVWDPSYLLWVGFHRRAHLCASASCSRNIFLARIRLVLTTHLRVLSH
jgi:hypothetical protein